MFVSSAAMRRGGAGAQELAKELVALQPDVIVAHTVSVAAALKHETSAIPIVFVSVGDPLGAGFIASLARPGGTLTGLMTFEAGISGKWVEMLKEVVPGLTRAMFVANPKTTPMAIISRPRRPRGRLPWISCRHGLRA